MADNILNNQQFREAARQFEKREGLPEGSLLSLANIESRGNPNAVSSAGARGTFQFMPATAKQYGVDVSNPWDSLRGAAEYLGDLTKQYKGNFKAALSHYNGGAYNAQYQVNGTVPSTDRVSPKNHEVNKNYVDSVLKGIPSFISSANAAEGPSTGVPVTNPTPPKAVAQPHEKLKTIAGLKIVQAKQQGVSDDDIVKGLAATAPPEIASVVKRNIEAGVSPSEIVQGMASKQLAQWEQDRKDADPTKSMTGLQKFGAGMGKAFVETYEGAKQLKTRVLGTDDDLKKLQAEQAERQKLDKPLIDTGAGQVGYAAGVLAPTVASLGAGAAVNAATKVPALANALTAARTAQASLGKVPNAVTKSVGTFLTPASAAQMAGAGAVQGALTPTTGDDQLLTNIAVGGAASGLGGMLVNAASNLIARPLGREVAERAPALIQQAEKFDLPLSASNIVMQAEKGGPAAWLAKRITNPTNQHVANVEQAIASQVGKGVGVEGARVIDNDLFLKAKPFAQFDQVTQGVQIPLSQASLQKELAGALDTYKNNTIGTNREAVSKVNALIEKAAPVEVNGIRVNPSFTPQTLQKWRSEIGADLAPETVSPQAEALLAAAKDSITKRLESGLTNEQWQAYRLANKQWENKLALEEMVKRSNNLGTLTPSQMVQAVKGSLVGHQFAQGSAPYQELAETINHLYGKHGLLQRPAANNLTLPEMSLGGVTAVIADPVTAVGSLLAKRLAEGLARKALDSQRPGVRNYLVGNTKAQQIASKITDSIFNPIRAQVLSRSAISEKNK